MSKMEIDLVLTWLLARLNILLKSETLLIVQVSCVPAFGNTQLKAGL